MFEWLSSLSSRTTVGISQATRRALPLTKHVIPCGVAADTFMPNNQKTEWPSLLFMGDLKSRKQGDYLIDLFNNCIIKKYPECKLTIIGPESCQGKNIIHLKQIPESRLIEEYQKAWIYCLPSSYEGFGVPAIEAMACGTVVIAIASHGVKEVITHENDGYIVNKSNYASSLLRLIAQTDLRNTLGVQGRETATKKFNISIIAEQYEKLYQNAI